MVFKNEDLPEPLEPIKDTHWPEYKDKDIGWNKYFVEKDTEKSVNSRFLLTTYNIQISDGSSC